MFSTLKKILICATIMLLMGFSADVMAAAPTGSITSVNPNLGTALTAGEVLEIVGNGTNFTLIPAGKVWFGPAVTGTVGTNMKVVDDTHIIITTPSLAKGQYAVTITDASNGNAIALAGAITFTTANRVLQVSMNVKIGLQCSIAWANGTSNDDTIASNGGGGAHGTTGANSISPFIWYLRDSDYGLANAQVSLGANYSTDLTGNTNSDGFVADNQNNHALLVTTASTTGSHVQVDAFTTDDNPSAAGTIWTAAGAAAADKFQVQACLGTAGAPQGSNGPKTLSVPSSVNLIQSGFGPTAGMVLNIQFSTPTSTTAALGTTHTITLSLVATAN
jgi:hypothetical protein